MKINNFMPAKLVKFKELEIGECFIYEDNLYMKIGVYNYADSDFFGDDCWDETAMLLPNAYVAKEIAEENPTVEWVDIVVNVMGVSN